MGLCPGSLTLDLSPSGHFSQRGQVGQRLVGAEDMLGLEMIYSSSTTSVHAVHQSKHVHSGKHSIPDLGTTTLIGNLFFLLCLEEEVTANRAPPLALLASAFQTLQQKLCFHFYQDGTSPELGRCTPNGL